MPAPEHAWPKIVAADLAMGKTIEECAEGWKIPLDTVQRLAAETAAPRRSLGPTDVNGVTADLLHSGESVAAVAERHGVSAAQIRRRHQTACGSHSECEHLPAPAKPAAKPPPRPRLRVVSNEPNPDWEAGHEPFDAGPWWETLLPVDEYPDPPPPLVVRTDGAPVIPGTGFVTVIGPRGSGKTWMALRIAADALQAGRRVVYFRSEGTRANLQMRLHTLGANPRTLLDDDKFRSIPRDQLDNFLVNHSEWAHSGVIIIDTIAAAGGTTNDTTEAQQWYDFTIARFVDEHTLIVGIDHTAKKIPDDVLAITSRGNSLKDDKADLVLFTDGYTGKAKKLTKTTWSKNKNGHFHLVVAKPHRDGDIDSDDTNRIATVHGYHDPATGLLRVTIDPPAADTPSNDKADDDEIYLIVLRAIHDAEGITSNDLIKTCNTSKVAQHRIRTARDHAIEQGHVYTKQPGQAKEHHLTFEGIQYLESYEATTT